MICPSCKRTFEPKRTTSRSGPFCSARCRWADLGHWLAGNYRIGSDLREEDLDASPIAKDDDEDAHDPIN